MSANVSRTFLREGATGGLVAADLYDAILPRHLDQHERSWKPIIAAQQEQHGHWDWRDKLAGYSGQLSYQSFSLECGGMVQGLMIVNTMKRCRMSSQANKHLVYVEYLEAAPWNRPLNPAGPTYKGVGKVLMAAAIQLSIDEGNLGRIGLHSLPQADAFYSRCGMTDMGPDTNYPKFPLRYFEMTETQASSFMKGG
ncbi:MAG: GNAT family N-acetyltransferase [Planctomycetaceae bacterium]